MFKTWLRSCFIGDRLAIVALIENLFPLMNEKFALKRRHAVCFYTNKEK